MRAPLPHFPRRPAVLCRVEQEGDEAFFFFVRQEEKDFRSFLIEKHASPFSLFRPQKDFILSPRMLHERGRIGFDQDSFYEIYILIILLSLSSQDHLARVPFFSSNSIMRPLPTHDEIKGAPPHT